MSAKKYRTGDVVPAGLEAQLVIARSWSEKGNRCHTRAVSLDAIQPREPAADFFERTMTEEQLLQSVRACARTLGWLTYHTRDSRGSDPGFCDLVLCSGKRVVFVELKSKTGRLSEAQKLWLNLLTAAGAEVLVWRPHDWLTGAIERCLRG